MQSYEERTFAESRIPSSIPHPLASPSFNLSFAINHHSFSGLKVDQLKVTGDVMYKPFKGVRTTAKAGKVDVRW